MTQDCSHSHSSAGVDQRLPKGIHIVGAEHSSASSIEGMSQPQPVATRENTADQPSSWSYLFLQHMAAKRLHRWLENYNHDIVRQPFFVHQSFRYCYKNEERQRGVRKERVPSVSGLVFLQGTVKDLQDFLKEYFPLYHLVNDCSTGRPASIPDAVMQPFMNVVRTHPEQLTFLRDPFERFARDHVRLRVVSGPFAGYEGYIVRIDRDRQLVFDFGGRAVAIRGVHNEQFEKVDG